MKLKYVDEPMRLLDEILPTANNTGPATYGGGYRYLYSMNSSGTQPIVSVDRPDAC